MRKVVKGPRAGSGGFPGCSQHTRLTWARERTQPLPGGSTRTMTRREYAGSQERMALRKGAAAR